jgi:hypothetical protein
MATDLLPLTVPEVRRLLFALVWHAPPSVEQVLHWSTWRRRHQARAKQAHVKRRQRKAAQGSARQRKAARQMK